MKAFAVVAEINELLVKNRFQNVTVKAGNIGLAAKRGWDQIRRRDGVKGKRISKVKLSIVAVDEQIEQEEDARDAS